MIWFLMRHHLGKCKQSLWSVSYILKQKWIKMRWWSRIQNWRKLVKVLDIDTQKCHQNWWVLGWNIPGVKKQTNKIGVENDQYLTNGNIQWCNIFRHNKCGTIKQNESEF